MTKLWAKITDPWGHMYSQLYIWQYVYTSFDIIIYSLSYLISEKYISTIVSMLFLVNFDNLLSSLYPACLGFEKICKECVIKWHYAKKKVWCNQLVCSIPSLSEETV